MGEGLVARGTNEVIQGLELLVEACTSRRGYWLEMELIISRQWLDQSCVCNGASTKIPN